MERKRFESLAAGGLDWDGLPLADAFSDEDQQAVAMAAGAR